MLVVGANDFHASAEQKTMERTFAEHIRKETEKRLADRLQRYKQIETLAYKLFDASISVDRFAEAVFGIVNEEAKI